MNNPDVQIARIILEEAKHSVKMLDGELKEYAMEKIDDAIVTLQRT